MRYKVLFVKLDKLAAKGFQSEVDLGRDLVIKGPTSKLQQAGRMIFFENRDNLVERKNAINKMVRRLPDDYDEQDRREYPSLRLRPSFLLQAVPDSTAADLPEPIIKSPLKKKTSNDVFAHGASLPEYGRHLPNKNNVKAKFVTVFKTQTPSQLPSKVRITPPRVRTPPPRVRTPPPNHIHANRSSCTTSDDKDFEIPLEESLKAVENFIRMEKELSKWAVGEYVLAQWKGNGLFYRAKILDINISGMILIIFDCYDIEDKIDYQDMHKYYRKDKNYIKKLGSSKVPAKDDGKAFLDSSKVPADDDAKAFLGSSKVPAEDESKPFLGSSKVPAEDDAKPFSVSSKVPAEDDVKPFLGSSKVPVKDNAKPDNKIKCAKKRSEEILQKALNKRPKVPLFKRSTMLRKKILRTYQKMRQQKGNVEYFSDEVLQDT